jgi:putative phosphoesterase
VIAIRGNNDRGAWAKKLPDILKLRVNGLGVYIIHNVNELEVDPGAEGFRAVISGHSHKPSISNLDGVMFLNPGSAGPRRFKLPVVVARLSIQKRRVHAAIIELKT